MSRREQAMGPFTAFLFVLLFAVIAAGASMLWTTPAGDQVAAVNVPSMNLFAPPPEVLPPQS